MVTGEPDAPVRHTWVQVHERARRIAGGLARCGVGHGDAVAVLAGAPVEIAPTAQGIWMRGASLTMLHQPTPRTDLVRWAAETTGVINMIRANAIIVSDPFMAAAPVLAEAGLRVLTIGELLDNDPIDPVRTDDDDLALMQLTSGSTGSPKAVQISHRNFVANAEAMFAGAEVDPDNGCHRQLASVLPRHGDDRISRGTNVFRGRAGEGNPDGLSARHLAVGEVDRQIQGHDDRRAQLRLQPLGQATAQAGHTWPVRPVFAAVGAVGRRTGRPGRRGGSVRGGRAVRVASGGDPACLWHGRDDRGGVVHRVRQRASRSTRWTPICSRCCAGLFRRTTAGPAGWPHSAVC